MTELWYSMLYDGAPQPDDLVAQFVAGFVDLSIQIVQVGGHIGAQRFHFRTNVSQIIFGDELRVHSFANIADFTTHFAQRMQDKVFPALRSCVAL
jgi:hypothetical protein